MRCVLTRLDRNEADNNFDREGACSSHLRHCPSHSIYQEEHSTGIGQTSKSREPSIYYQPCGVSLIIANSDQILRHGIAALSASIAARNTVALASSKPNSLLSKLQKEAFNHLDVSSIHILSEPVSEFQPEECDHVLIPGKHHLSY